MGRPGESAAFWAAHVVHHAVNLRYVDRNDGGILVVWDRLVCGWRDRASLPLAPGLSRYCLARVLIVAGMLRAGAAPLKAGAS